MDDHDFEHPLIIANKKHDVVALQLYDRREKILPPVGLMYLTDAETGESVWVDTRKSGTSSKRMVSNEIKNWIGYSNMPVSIWHLLALMKIT